VDLRLDGIHVFTNRPELIPKEVEEVPILVHPATRKQFKNASHSFNTPLRPLHGAVMSSDNVGGTRER